MKQKIFALTGVAAMMFSLQAAAAVKVYIPLGSANTVIKVDAATGQIEGNYPGPVNPHGLVAVPGSDYLMAGSLYQDGETSYLYKVHPGHGHVMSKTAVKGWTHHQAATPDGRYVISTHGMAGDISVFDMKANKVVKRIPTGEVPNYTLVSADGRTAWVSNAGSNDIAEVDLEAGKVTRRLESGPSPEHMAFDSSREHIWVSNADAGTVTQVDIASGKAVRSIPLGAEVHGLDASADGRSLFVSVKGADKIVRIDTLTGALVSAPLGPMPYHLNTVAGTDLVYVSSRAKPVVWAVDGKTLQVRYTVNLPGGEGHQMAVVDE